MQIRPLAGTHVPDRPLDSREGDASEGHCRAPVLRGAGMSGAWGLTAGTSLWGPGSPLGGNDLWGPGAPLWLLHGDRNLIPSGLLPLKEPQVLVKTQSAGSPTLRGRKGLQAHLAQDKLRGWGSPTGLGEPHTGAQVELEDKISAESPKGQQMSMTNGHTQNLLGQAGTPKGAPLPLWEWGSPSSGEPPHLARASKPLDVPSPLGSNGSAPGVATASNQAPQPGDGGGARARRSRRC